MVTGHDNRRAGIYQASALEELIFRVLAARGDRADASIVDWEREE